MRDNKGRFLKGYKLTAEECHKLSESHKGRKFSKETREKIRLKNIGRKASPQTRLKQSLAKRKGETLGYQAVHKLLRKILMPPNQCEFCHKPKKLQLANMTGIYNLDLKNWKYLCARCHIYHDGTINNLRH